MRSVANIIQSKPPVFNSINSKAKVIEGLHLMNSINLSYLVVKDEEEFAGIFSEREYSRNVILKGLHSDTCTVEEVMNKTIPVVSMEDTVEHCMEMLNSHKTRYLVVFDNNQFVGVVTINDVLREALQSKEMVFDKLSIFNVTEDKIF